MEHKKTKNRSGKKKWLWAWKVTAIVLVGACGMAWAANLCLSKYEGEQMRIFLPAGSSVEAIGDTLRARLGDDIGSKALRLWVLRDGTAARAVGSYVVRPGMTAFEISRKLLYGSQDPVRVTFNNVRTVRQLAERVARHMEFGPDDFIAACDSVLPALGYCRAEYQAAFVPDTYEFYWTATPEYVVSRLEEVQSRFWTDERLSKAMALGLTPRQVCTLASIVEEETNKADERPVVARLYLNRLSRGMKLQADPTVKYAVGDFGLRRITGRHLSVESPYNTYLHQGLPPGPIRIVERQAMDDVLNAPEHDYIFMCAKEDFSGYHNFAVTGDEHAANARRYHKALNARGIR